jgi:hypothetical protein
MVFISRGTRPEDSVKKKWEDRFCQWRLFLGLRYVAE